MKDYSLSDKYKYFCQMSKKGARKSNGQSLTDFERGVYMGKAISIQENAQRFYRNKDRANKGNDKTKKLNMNERSYTDAELNSLFDNNKEIKFD